MKTKKIIRTYNELKNLKTFEERYNYLQCNGEIGFETFGHDRYLNQALYNSPEWHEARKEVILRDKGCDLGIEGFEIMSKALVHHMNPITIEQVLNKDPDIFNPNYLITVTHKTHNAIHYGKDKNFNRVSKERKPGDTKLW